MFTILFINIIKFIVGYHTIYSVLYRISLNERYNVRACVDFMLVRVQESYLYYFAIVAIAVIEI